MLRSNPSAVAGGCTAEETASVRRDSEPLFSSAGSPDAVNLGVWGGAPGPAESGKSFLFRHLKSLIVAEPRHKYYSRCYLYRQNRLLPACGMYRWIDDCY